MNKSKIDTARAWREARALLRQHRGSLALGLGLMLGYSGGLFATYPLARLVQGQGWRQALLEVGGVGFVIWVGLAISWLLFSGVKPPLAS